MVLAALVLLAMAMSPSLARADEAYDKVAGSYARAGGQLDPCQFTQAELTAAIRGIPPSIRDVVPALRRAMQDGVAAHERGECRGRRPEEGTTGGATPGAGAIPPTTTPPVTTPTQTAPATTVPPTTTDPAPLPATTPAPAAAPVEPATTVPSERDRTPLLVALVALGALLLLALLTWAIARARGWDPVWVARTRHAWGEAGFRTTSTWSEFTDWLRLGR